MRFVCNLRFSVLLSVVLCLACGPLPDTLFFRPLLALFYTVFTLSVQLQCPFCNPFFFTDHFIYSFWTQCGAPVCHHTLCKSSRLTSPPCQTDASHLTVVAQPCVCTVDDLHFFRPYFRVCLLGCKSNSFFSGAITNYERQNTISQGQSTRKSPLQ